MNKVSTMNLKNINKVSLIIGILFYVFLYVMIVFMSYSMGIMLYPKLNERFLLPLFIFILPFVAEVILLIICNKINSYIKHIISIGVVVLATIMSIILGLFFICFPPIISSTDNTDNYLVVDKGLEGYKEDYQLFLPVTIPASAQNISYMYRKESNILDDNLNISLEYTLSGEEYKAEKDGILERCFSESLDGKQEMYYIYPKGKSLDGRLKMTLVCDDENNRLIYNVSTGRYGE